MAKRSRSAGLRIIAVGKALKAVTLITFGVMALSMAGQDLPEALRHWANALRVDPGNHYLNEAIGSASGVDATKLREIGLGTFVYAALFSTEGVGLWLQKRWAEYFTMAITVSFIPLEIYEIARHASVPKIVTLVLNVAVVIYLVVRVRYERHHDQDQRKESHDQPSALGGQLVHPRSLRHSPPHVAST